MNRMNKMRGLTLVETLIVCVIIGLLMTSAIPSFQLMTENRKIETLSEELFSDLNSTKIAAVSIGEDYKFKFEMSGWIISKGSTEIKRKKINDNNLYIEEDFDYLVFKPLGFTKDKNGNTLAVKKIKICNAKTKSGYEIEINGFGKTKIKETICD